MDKNTNICVRNFNSFCTILRLIYLIVASKSWGGWEGVFIFPTNPIGLLKVFLKHYSKYVLEYWNNIMGALSLA